MKATQKRLEHAPRLGQPVRRKASYIKYYLIVIPILVAWFFLHVYPNVEIFPLSFYKWDGLTAGQKVFVGWQNFKLIFRSDAWFKRCFSNTSAYIVYTLLLQTVLALALALALRKNCRHNNLFRTLFFVPIVLSSVAVSLIWKYVYDVNIGLLHNFFKVLGFTRLADFQYLSGTYQRLFFIAVVQVWAGIGIPITLFTAALQSVPEEIYEASALDGANAWQTFWKVTLPQIMPSVLRVTMLTISGAAMAFDYIIMMAGGDSSAPYYTWAVVIYKNMTEGSNQGMVAANSVLLALLMLIICLVQFIATRKAEDSYM